MVKPLIEPAELVSMMESEPLVVIDTRDPEEYAKGHIPGAFNVREIFTYLATSDPEGVAALKDKFSQIFGAIGLSGRETAVVYEDAMNTGFGQSCRGYYLLELLGYPHATILHGGYRAWVAKGLPVSTATPVATPAVFPTAPAEASVLVTKEHVLSALEDPAVVKLDVRDYDEWVGASSSPYGIDFCPRKGRLPGAVWIEWYRMMDPDLQPPLFKSRRDISAACREVGIYPDSKVYIYCFKGARASNTYVALKEAGITDVKIYFGSWNEWSRDPALPIEEGPPHQDRMAARLS